MERRKRIRRASENYKHVEVSYNTEDVYLDYLLNIFGNVPTGRYIYPFSYQLPLGLPASYEGLHGNIVYSIEADIPRSWAADCKAFTLFRVLGSVDLNFTPEAQQEGLLRQRQSFGCCCCKTGAASFVLKLQKRGVTVGEFIHFIVDISNKSNKTLVGKLCLIQEVKFYAQGKQRKVVNVICSAEGPSIPPGEDDIWRGNVLQVPPVVPTRLGSGCHLIDVSYELKMELSGSGFFFSLNGKTPIVIGTLPIRNPGQMDHTIYEPPPSYTSVVNATDVVPGASASSSTPYFHNLMSPENPGPVPSYASAPPKFLG